MNFNQGMFNSNLNSQTSQSFNMLSANSSYSLPQAIQESLRQSLLNGQLSSEVLGELIKSLSILQTQQQQMMRHAAENPSRFGGSGGATSESSASQLSSNSLLGAGGVQAPPTHHVSSISAPSLSSHPSLAAAALAVNQQQLLHQNQQQLLHQKQLSHHIIPSATVMPSGQVEFFSGIPIVSPAASISDRERSNTPLHQAATTFGAPLEEFKDFSKMILTEKKSKKRSKKVGKDVKEVQPGDHSKKIASVSSVDIFGTNGAHIDSDHSSSNAANATINVTKVTFQCSECKRTDSLEFAQNMCESCFK